MNKINLISPPDKLFNSHLSFNLVCATDKEKEQLSFALGKSDSNNDIDIYVYNNENNVVWLFEILNRKNLTYINLDNIHDNVVQYTSYIISLPNVYYTTSDEIKTANYQLLSTNKIDSFDDFIQRILNDK